MTRFGVMVSALVLFTVPLGFGPSAAISPFDDDAGSGGDAGDHPLLATPVEPGTFSGHLAAPNDFIDVYAFSGEAGDMVTFQATSDSGSRPKITLRGPEALTSATGDVHATGSANSFPRTTILPVSGTWYIEADINPNHPAPVTYTIDFQQAPLENVASASLNAPSFGVETRMDEPTDVYVSIRATTTQTHVTAPTANTILYDYTIWDPLFTSGIGGVRLWDTGIGDAWEVNPAGVGGESPIDVLVPYGVGIVQSTFYAQNVTGWLRFTAYFTEHVGEISVVVWSANQAEWGTGKGGNVTAHRTADLSGDDLVLPGLAPEGPRSLNVTLPDQTLGWALGGGAKFDATAPDGTVFTSPPPPVDQLQFYYPDAGEWSFAFDPPEHNGPDADRIWFDHFQMPSLGIADPPLFSLPVQH